MSQQTLKESKEDRESCKVELSSLRVPLKSKTLTRINESKHYKNILKTRPHPELQEQRLLLAVSTNNTERVLSLLESGVNPDAADKQLRSALHLATSRGYAEIVRHLLDYGADPNKLDIIRNTPLHLAACLNNFAIIKMLLDAGADVRSLDGYGRDPVQLAQSKLQLLRRSWREGSIEMVNLRSQLQQVIDVMISVWKRKEEEAWGCHRETLYDLQLMKLSLTSGPPEQVDDQMDKLLSELQSFSIK